VSCALVLAACANGVSETKDDGDGGTASGGDGGAGGDTGGAAPSCTDDAQCIAVSDDCHTGRCEDGECMAEVANEGLACDDDEVCTPPGTCAAGTCQITGALDCSALDDACGTGVCDPKSGCIRVPANENGSCDDGLFCTVNDACDADGACMSAAAFDCGAPSSTCATIACNDDIDACEETPITACVSGDMCCPSGCTLALDDDCNCGTNLALTATPLSSGGGLPACCGVELMNDGVTEPTCSFHWINNAQVPSGAYIEYQWAAPVTIGSLYVATQQASLAVCASAGRNLESGTVQYWDGVAWVTSTTFSGQLDDVALDLPAPVTTTGLRIYDVITSPGNGNSMIYEWFVYPGTGCTP
jgi:hypothetical protein